MNMPLNQLKSTDLGHAAYAPKPNPPGIRAAKEYVVSDYAANSARAFERAANHANQNIVHPVQKELLRSLQSLESTRAAAAATASKAEFLSPGSKLLRPALVIGVTAGFALLAVGLISVTSGPGKAPSPTGVRAEEQTAARQSAAEQSKAAPSSHLPTKLGVTVAPARRMGETFPLGVSVRDVGDGGLVLVRGLAAGTTLSLGKPMNDNSWWLALADLNTVVIQPPAHFVGTMDVTVELRLADTALSDSRTIRFEWEEENVAEIEPTPDVTFKAPSRPAPQPVAKVRALEPAKVLELPPKVLEAPLKVPERHVNFPEVAVKAALAPHLSTEEIAALMKRGNDLIASGDLAAARLVLLRASVAGDARAALTLAGTFDPIVLNRLGVHGFSPDLSMARYWYQKAKEFGSPEAQRRLEVAGH
jgi:hypothetical protein